MRRALLLASVVALSGCMPTFDGLYKGLWTEKWTDPMGKAQEASAELTLTVETKSKTEATMNLDIDGKTCALNGTYKDLVFTLTENQRCDQLIADTKFLMKTGGAQLSERTDSMPATRTYVDRSGRTRMYTGTKYTSTVVLSLTLASSWDYGTAMPPEMGTSAITYEGERKGF